MVVIAMTVISGDWSLLGASEGLQTAVILGQMVGQGRGVLVLKAAHITATQQLAESSL